MFFFGGSIPSFFQATRLVLVAKKRALTLGKGGSLPKFGLNLFSSIPVRQWRRKKEGFFVQRTLLLPSFFAVTCLTTGKERRFAARTAAGFTVSLINKKLGTGSPFEAAKAGEKPIVFGPNAVLVDKGNGWKLQTVTDLGHTGGNTPGRFLPRSTHAPDLGYSGSHSSRAKVTANQAISFVYVGKIVIAFIFTFVKGPVFTLALEYLPLLIEAINKLM